MAVLLKLLAVPLIFLAGCASVETRLPTPDIQLMAKEADLQEKRAFLRYLEMLERLDRISAQVLQANAELCDKKGVDLGMLTHATGSYPKHLRTMASNQVDAKAYPTVFLVRKGGSAEAAGLRTGDVIVDGENEALSVHGKELPAFLEANGHIRKRSRTEVGYTEINVGTTPVCDYPVRLKFSEAVNAYANGKAITVTTGMMDFATRDEELALVIGHELAHNTMRHVRKSIQNILLSGFATRYTRPFESEADYVGLYYTARAGFELEGVEDFWRRLGIKNPKSIVRAKTHPVTPARMLSISATRQEIKTKREAGQNLVPNYLVGKGPEISE